jgi:lactate dehydrogenase-like 2-hydroxyacid dehydrogenase
MVSKPEVLMIGPYPAWDMEDLDACYVVHKLWEAADRDHMVESNRSTIQAIATRGELGASADLMKRLPKLEIVSCYGVGTDAIDLVYAKANGIKVTNTPDVLTADVADMAVGLLLSVARKIPQADQFVREGSWAKGNMPLVTRVSGKRVGVVGMGRVGAAVAKRLAAFDCEVAYFDLCKRADLPYEFLSDLVELARRSEFLVVTLAGGESTKGLINTSILDALGPDGVLVNVSRGSTVDETALVRALEAKSIKGAGLDVFWNEPHIDARFKCLDNVALQPHHASGTIETRRAMGKLVRDNLAAHFSGAALITPVP